MNMFFFLLCRFLFIVVIRYEQLWYYLCRYLGEWHGGKGIVCECVYTAEVFCDAYTMYLKYYSVLMSNLWKKGKDV